MTKHIQKAELIFALIFAAFISVGRMIDTEGRLHWLTISDIIIFVLCATGTYLVLLMLEKIASRIDAKLYRESRVNGFLVFLFFMIAYGIVLHEVYPGFFVYDAATELMQFVRGSNDTWHPVFHTWLSGEIITFFYGLHENYNEGIFAYIFFQMTVMSLGFTYFIKELSRYGIPRFYRVMAMVFLGVFPTSVMYVLCSVTDSFFAFFVFMLTIQLVALFCTPEIYRKEPYRFIMLFLFLLMIMLFRKNGIYDVVVFIPFLVAFAIKRYKKKLLLISVFALAAYFCVNSMLVSAMDAEKVGQQEAFSVPIQQIGRTYKYYPEEFDEEDIAYLSELQPIEYWDRYFDKLADELKENIDGTVILSDAPRFISFYFKFFLRHPITYVNAWLLTSYEQWYPGAIFDCYNGMAQYEEVSYFGWITEEPGWRNLAESWGDKIYRAISVRLWPHRIPFVRLLFTPGFWLWIMLGGCVYVGRDNKGFARAFLFIFLVFATMLLGPCSLVRYVAFVFFAAPLMIGGILFKSRFKENA